MRIVSGRPARSSMRLNRPCRVVVSIALPYSLVKIRSVGVAPGSADPEGQLVLGDAVGGEDRHEAIV